MKALSIRQPWAHLIIHGFKTVENRTWFCKYRGPLLIHASKTMTAQEQSDAYAFALDETTMRSGSLPAKHELHMGGIIGIVDVVDCVPHGSSSHQNMLPMDLQWFVGDYGIILRNASLLPFRPYKGKLGLFEVNEEECPYV